MTDKQKKDQEEPVVPPSTPVETPSAFAHPDQHSFILQSVLEMQKTLGSLERAIDTFSASSNKQSDKIDDFNDRLHQIEKRVYAAGAILVVLSGILSILVPWLWNIVTDFMSSRFPPIAS